MTRSAENIHGMQNSHLSVPPSESHAPRGARSARFWHAPAVRAALIQALAFVPTIALLYVLARWHVRLPLYAAAVLQGTIATVLTWAWKLARWWRPIEFVYPVALLGAHGLHVPPAALLSAFIVLLLLFWSTFRTQVPFYPSGRAVSRAVASLISVGRPVRLIDIGSGLGGLVLDLGRRHPAAKLSGIELAPLPWLISVVRGRVTGSAARFLRGNYERLDFAHFDIVFAYLSPAAMVALWWKASTEMRPGTMLVSYEFTIPGKVPDQTIASSLSGPALFVWYF